MKRITILMTFLVTLGMYASFAQQKVSGVVTGADDGSPIPGVTVLAKGADKVGAVTNFEGKYTVDVPSGVTTLVFSFVGMVTQEVDITGKTTVNVVMESGDVAIDDVVVTALGISREKKKLGYAVQEVGSEDIVSHTENNIMSAISGKVAGVQITSPSGNFGGSTRVLIRGASSFTGNNNPLYVVDGIPIDNGNFSTADQIRGGGGYDYGNMTSDINPSDIASISVLKGAAATALYGSRAANGAIIITTKSGDTKRKKGIGVQFNTGVTFEKVAKLPDYQNKYGGGYYDYFDTVQVDGKDYLIPYYGADESWGPKLEGQEVVAYHNLYDYEKGYTENLETSPWVAHPDNIKDFFETGVAYTNNIALTGGDALRNFRLSYTNLNRTGIFPNSEIKKNTFHFSGQSKIGNKLTASAKANYISYEANALPANGYGDNSIMQKFAQWGQRQWDMEEMKNYKNDDGTQRTWNRTGFSNPSPAYSDNPYWTQNENFSENWRNRFFGRAELAYEITDWLTASADINADYYTDRRTERVSQNSAATSYYEEALREVKEINSEIFLRFNKSLTEDIDLSGFVGAANRYYSYYRNVNNTNGGIGVPGFYSLENSIDPLSPDDNLREKKISSVLGNATVSYKDLLFVDLALRNDWSSTLPKDNWSYMYPAVSASFNFSELSALQNVSWLNFSKLRASWAQVGNDTDPYQLYATYEPFDNFGSYPRYSIPDQLNNSELKPEKTTSIEFGLEARFLNDRLGFDVTYYDMNTIEQLVPVDVSPATGYETYMINAGEMSNKGVELMVNLTPVKLNDFQWDIDVNFAKNKNEVVSLAKGVDNINIENSLWGVYVTARKGQAYEMIRATNYVYDDQGRIVVDEDGYLLTSSAVEELGSVLPDWTGGIRNTFTYKGISLSALIDIRKGGHLFSTTHMFGSWTGLFEASAGNNDKGIPMRDPVDEGGGMRYTDAVVGHIDDDGNVVVDSETNEVYLDAYDWAMSHYFGPRAQNVFETDFMKLRELSIGYTVPAKMLSSLPISGLRISFVGRNLAMWGNKVPHIDPEHATNAGNLQGIEGGTNPSTKTYGFNLSIDF